jgi:hypothetical protein
MPLNFKNIIALNYSMVCGLALSDRNTAPTPNHTAWQKNIFWLNRNSTQNPPSLA